MEQSKNYLKVGKALLSKSRFAIFVYFIKKSFYLHRYSIRFAKKKGFSYIFETFSLISFLSFFIIHNSHS